MRLDKIIEEKIQEAIANGEFDNLEGAGKPLNLDEYFAAPEDVRVGYFLLKSNKFVPQEVDLLTEIGDLKEKIRTGGDKEKANHSKLLNEKTLALSIILERNQGRKTKK